MSEAGDKPVLAIRDLAVSFDGGDGLRVRAVDGVTLDVHAGKMLAVVGESGSGKSVTAMSVLRLLPQARIDRGSIDFTRKDGTIADLAKLPSEKMRQIRGGEIAMIFQEPMTSLNPVFSIGEQILEAVLLHQNVTKAKGKEIATEALRKVKIDDPVRRYSQYPHEFSGGMRQRVMIAMALACRPRVLLADEPTTALDVTVQAEVLRLVKELSVKEGLGVMLITHDLGLVREHADDVAVMYAGRVVERGSAKAVLSSPRHPYTRGLLKCVPRLGERKDRLVTVQAELDGAEFEEVAGKRPWWPRHDAPAGATECKMVEVSEGHSALVWR